MRTPGAAATAEGAEEEEASRSSCLRSGIREVAWDSHRPRRWTGPPYWKCGEGG